MVWVWFAYLISFLGLDTDDVIVVLLYSVEVIGRHFLIIPNLFCIYHVCLHKWWDYKTLPINYPFSDHCKLLLCIMFLKRKAELLAWRRPPTIIFLHGHRCPGDIWAGSWVLNGAGPPLPARPHPGPWPAGHLVSTFMRQEVLPRGPLSSLFCRRDEMMTIDTPRPTEKHHVNTAVGITTFFPRSPSLLGVIILHLFHERKFFGFGTQCLSYTQFLQNTTLENTDG